MKRKRRKIRGSSSSSSPHTSYSQSSDLHTAVVTNAVAQICSSVRYRDSVGYRGAQTSALETLAAVAVAYLQSLAKHAVNSANSTGRTQCNLLDVIRALEDLHSAVGFNGNSDVKRRLYVLSDSSILRDLMRFVRFTREIPFAKPLPRRCHTLPPNPPCFIDESGKWKHVPRWLPAFPELAGGGGEETVAPAPNEAETETETETDTEWKRKCFTVESGSNREVSELPGRRKKVSFTIIGGGGGGGRNVNVIDVKSGVDLRIGICKGGKRVSCQIYDDDDDENFVNAASCSSHLDPKVKPLTVYKRRNHKSKRDCYGLMFKQNGPN